MARSKIRHIRKRDNLLDVAISGLESFREYSGLAYDEFIAYMDKYDVWSVMSNVELIWAMVGGGIEEAVEIFGSYLTQEEQQLIIDRYETKMGRR